MIVLTLMLGKANMVNRPLFLLKVALWPEQGYSCIISVSFEIQGKNILSIVMDRSK